ncbi:hypothetical protein [uncultured Dokdonia sp.]|uniref:hypothetical protein n=1 Tax=uncultured Dokdonia sp. TaxID=575653 RepID=UPI00260FF63E|nr:hypothetical protein [uncultured Dokdonia sp.]
MRYIILFLLVTFPALSQDITPGTIISSIALDDTQKDTYALYLPRDYDENKKYPIVFVFDETGAGDRAAQQFTIGAELTKSIIVGANFAITDSLKTALKQSEKLINTVYQRYAIDPTRIILAGRGNGALIASAGAYKTQKIKGVIAVNDIYLDNTIFRKNSDIKLTLISGDENPNYYKLRAYQNVLRSSSSFEGYYEYTGGEEWPEAGFLSAAMVDIIMTMSTPVEDVQRYYESDLAFGELLYRQQKHLSAFSFVQDLKKQYKDRVAIDAQKKLLKTIRGNATFKAKRSRKTSVRYAELLLAEDFQYYLTEDAKNSYFDNLGWWNFQMNDLDAKIDSTASNNQERKASIRLKGFAKTLVEDKYKEVLEKKPKIEQLLFMNILRTLVDPNNQQAFINAISLSAKEGDVNASLFYLEELLKSGFTNYELLYNIDGTTALRIGEEWNAIVKAYLGKSKFYDD